MARRRYGYKPKAVSIRGMTPQQIIEAMKDPAVRLFRIAFGERRGETAMASNVPWAGITEGATGTADAIERIRAVNPALARNCETFAREASHAKGTTWVINKKGKRILVPAAAAARMKGVEIVA